MPIFLEPDVEFPVVLDSDKDKTPKPTFWAKSQDARGQIKIGETIDLLHDSDLTISEVIDKTVQKLLEVFTRWSNMGEYEFCEENLYRLGFEEQRELLRKVMYNQHVTAEEKKSSE